MYSFPSLHLLPSLKAPLLFLYLDLPQFRPLSEEVWCRHVLLTLVPPIPSHDPPQFRPLLEEGQQARAVLQQRLMQQPVLISETFAELYLRARDWLEKHGDALQPQQHQVLQVSAGRWGGC